MSTGVAGAAADVLVRCDVGPEQGVGHLMRCVAFAEELVRRDLSVVFCGDVTSVPFAVRQLESRGLPFLPAVHTAEEHVALVDRLSPRLVVVDSYLMGNDVYAALRASAPRLLALIDGPPEGRVADVFLDQNVGADQDEQLLPEGAVRLAGLRYVLLRDDLLAARPASPGSGQAADPPRVLAFFGGTDAFGAAPAVSALLARTRLPFSLTVVAGSAQSRARLAGVALAPGQTMEVIDPTERIAGLVTAADLVISAAGGSTWELACLGAASGLVRVADNQEVGYQRMIRTGGAVGVGSLAEVHEASPEAQEAVRRLLRDETLRSRLRRDAWELIDGRGRARVADVALTDGARGRPPGSS